MTDRLPAPLRVLIADDHPIFREGLRMLLSSLEGVTVAGEAATTSEAVALAGDLAPDVVVLDVDMPEAGGVAAIPAIKAAASGTGVLMLTMLEDDLTLAAAVRAGASGYLLKGPGQSEVVAALRSVAAGGFVVSAGVSQRLRDTFLAGDRVRPAPLPELTDREREVVALVGRGLANPAIAQRLYLSPKTVRNLVSSAMGKLGVGDRAALAIRARDAGLQ
jgi:DNA-binding NarL/FixJ family response regulator